MKNNKNNNKLTKRAGPEFNTLIGRKIWLYNHFSHY